MSIPIHNSDVDHLAFEDEVLVFDGELLQRLVGSAAAIWRHIDGIRSAEQIVRDLGEAFGPDADLTRDVPAFLAELKGADLIRMEPTVPGRFSIPSTVAWDRDGERVLMADLQTGTRTALSETATLVWLLAGEGLTAQEVVSDLSDSFPDAPPTLATDVIVVLDELVAGGWLRAG